MVNVLISIFQDGLRSEYKGELPDIVFVGPAKERTCLVLSRTHVSEHICKRTSRSFFAL
jgi:hypothetical protein